MGEIADYYIENWDYWDYYGDDDDEIKYKLQWFDFSKGYRKETPSQVKKKYKSEVITYDSEGKEN